MGKANEHIREEVKTVQAVERALSILEVLAGVGRPISITEIAEVSNLNVSTVHRLLGTLMVKGLVDQENDTAKYKLTMKLFQIGNAALYNVDIQAIARPYMQELLERCNETVNLSVLDGTEVVYVDQLESTNMVIVKMFVKVGNKGPAHCTSSGKVLLAGLPQEKLEQIINKIELKKYTNETITDVEMLKKELDRVRKQGYAFSLGERDESVRCLAAPIHNHQGKVVASISVSGPASRITSYYLNNELIPIMLDVSAKISSKMGYNN
ncbi:DNA-binding IclR family transcriptional regulator [Desulfitispora alkaliphila]|uniref:IclR family transcriptional regulator n=1 Tax=Desulfitispora alkaliphila TaxID=622674 RepID=UPI003D1BC406